MEQDKLKISILEFLNSHRKMVLTVLDKNKFPNSSLLLYVTDDDLRVYFGTRKSFGKYAALQADPHVSLAVVEEGIDPLRVVDMQGIVQEIPESHREEKLKWFTQKNPADYYVKESEDFVLFYIVPFSVRFLDASSGDLCMYDLDHTCFPAEL